MNRLIITTFISITQLFAVRAYWDLGIGITEFSEPNYTHDISLSTYHRIEGLKKYYDMDYNLALYHFKEVGQTEIISVFYQYVDCYYLLGQYDKALSIIESRSFSSPSMLITIACFANDLLIFSATSNPVTFFGKFKLFPSGKVIVGI